MSNVDLARNLQELAESYVNRSIALVNELEFLASHSILVFTPPSTHARRAELRRKLENLPWELSRAAASVLKSDPAHAGHLEALRRAGTDDNLESVGRELKRVIDALTANSTANPRIEILVTLSQAAPLANLNKRTLERYLFDEKIPDPDYRGGDGKASKWKWSNLRPALEKVCNRRLPEQFPGGQII